MIPGGRIFHISDRFGDVFAITVVAEINGCPKLTGWLAGCWLKTSFPEFNGCPKLTGWLADAQLKITSP